MTKCSLMTCVVLTCAAVLSADGVPNDWFPRWSPDGKRIVFMSDRSGDPEIYVMNADGFHAVRLTSSPGRDRTRPSRAMAGGSRSNRREETGRTSTSTR
ncbi:MAG: TolB family protein [Thermoanaerobaculia bacterium]